MAEPVVGSRPRTVLGLGDDRPVTWLAMIRVLVGSRLRSQLAYRTSLALDLFSQAFLVASEFIEIWVLLVHAPVLGGMTLSQAALVYVCSQFGFGLADLLFGELENAGDFVKQGRLETLLVRPTSLLTQLVTTDFQLRRLGRVLVGVIAYPWLLVATVDDWTAAKVGLAVIAPLGGAGIFTGLQVWAGAFTMVVVDGKQASNAVMYGGKFASGVPGGALFTPVRVFFTFVAPTLLSAWLPMAVVSGAGLPHGWPAWLGWLSPVAALVVWATGLVAWGRAIRHYTGAGG
ncbi:ABC-2 family transporter protein [Aestuariimicrobium kwangyangense]|uniref:ABC-2 family transporter protein n=1 Tax=Aestuariimicrobium kwangyangense TaxID=396389 RepID=UPI0003B76D2E|nr:ABC-2 family transporter protein [Aestuariimicrobium kwangyangense]